MLKLLNKMYDDAGFDGCLIVFFLFFAFGSGVMILLFGMITEFLK